VTDPAAAVTITASAPGLAVATLTLPPGRRD
jgi:hypothetical protein